MANFVGKNQSGQLKGNWKFSDATKQYGTKYDVMMSQLSLFTVFQRGNDEPHEVFTGKAQFVGISMREPRVTRQSLKRSKRIHKKNQKHYYVHQSCEYSDRRFQLTWSWCTSSFRFNELVFRRIVKTNTSKNSRKASQKYKNAKLLTWEGVCWWKYISESWKVRIRTCKSTM